MVRVGLYVDAFNVYYGGRDHCGKGAPGWRWLDLAGLAESLIDPTEWPDASIERMVYCTAPRDRAGDPTSIADQQCYIGALQTTTPGLVVEDGKYVPRVKKGVLVREKRRRAFETVPAPDELPEWLPAKPFPGPEGDDVLMVAVSTFEEKGSDVNVASHLLIDLLTDRIDAAMVMSNDSDLGFPLRFARSRIPVATINPGTKPTVSELRGDAGPLGHWWRRLTPEDFWTHQLPDPAGPYDKPEGW